MSKKEQSERTYTFENIFVIISMISEMRNEYKDPYNRNINTLLKKKKINLFEHNALLSTFPPLVELTAEIIEYLKFVDSENDREEDKDNKKSEQQDQEIDENTVIINMYDPDTNELIKSTVIKE